ncbi:hypothetical protein I3843_04G017200 [Carya illinoinensis]|uniref:NAC domain-containing protein n=1 Tax=Carya illinoinensis TaxID=32201 RepID=A0A922F9P9_CARIL|nr:hypothetical protein I3842_04G017800 [Carya illinoinensis]KAG7981814.1 hypothetical protein I3843_04G017200 [Carya illinoinensis]
MDETNDIVDKVDDVMLPGFRFHPTDEELVGFYLKTKIQRRPLPIELIKQVDIYKYDPWDLPKEVAATGEKEWYFYCPRDRKYRNSARPNRVTGAGFWKATGTDRPIYSSEGTKCIGLKKSLVFYRGRAAKGIKTDWMMHEFRLPSLSESAPPKFLDKNITANDSWAICRIFKKTNSMAQRTLSQSWVSSLPETLATDMLTQGKHYSQFRSENISNCTTETGPAMQFCTKNDLQQTSAACFSTSDILSYKPINHTVSRPPLFHVSNGELPSGFPFSPLNVSGPTKCTVDSTSMLLNSPLGDVTDASGTLDFEGSQQQFSGFSLGLHQEMQGHMGAGEDHEAGLRKNPDAALNNQWGTVQSIGFPFSLPSNDDWKPNVPWDSPPCPSLEMSTNHSTNE